ncbi:UDP-4-amino-4,6-dideoxy-N-acetyl-beta-L-altrosami ne transaminase [Geomonas limicola]|uniref:UDP-4-amino-4,6-dideoxy-N-acetyl-beta-L-altrosami ne transaminase n=1 Tax=Geomonas limicola TaxID=2740186 RepID=A0A6V8NBB4_9BACT|nr:UDP-4-amino-4,6-dideoxy-N-acetyl-beta-L-altrosamine transaminase [Geomonas limicola]GFO68509.1 UDP-4-amino-4,6-dideoxy-N-acetyl-beta-L-altrosami ne transaminase [Geomonas limicola]
MPHPFIPYGRQSVSEADIEAVCAVLRSDWLTQGPTLPRFEAGVAARCGAAHAVAVNSATSALHLACLALGLGPGDTLWTSPNTFVASANCARYCGALVDFVDIDPKSYNLCPVALERKLERAAQTGSLPKVLVPVHFSGQPCAMERIAELAAAYGVRVVEDASHAIGASYQEEPVGNCRYSDLTVFSFHPVKIVTTGEGGMLLTQSPELNERLVRLRSHGITRDPALMEGEPDGDWYYQQLELGFNYRMTDLQAALGLSQLERLEEFVERRRLLAERYRELLEGLPLVLPWQASEARSAWHLFVVRLDPERARLTRRQLFDQLRQAGVGVNVHYQPVHTQPYYRRLGFAPGMFPQAEAYYAQALTLPLYPGLEEAQQDRVVGLVREALS